MIPPLNGRRQECLLCLLFTVAWSGDLTLESCWSRESSGLTEGCFGFFSLSLMTGHNWVPLTLALAAGVQSDHPVSALVGTEHKHWRVNVYEFFCELCSEAMSSCPSAFVTNFFRSS